MDDQQFQEALNTAALAKEEWTVQYGRYVDGNADLGALALAAKHAIDTSETVEEARNGRQRTNDHNKGLYPCVETLVVILVYLISSTLMCVKHSVEYSNMKGNKLVNGLYFVVVTTMTIGYGDISPLTKRSKIYTMIMVLSAILISYMGNILVDAIKSWLKKRCFTCVKGWKKEVILISLSLLVVEICIVVGMLGVLYTEHKCSHCKMDILDSFCLSILSLATVGYGDISFKHMGGKRFAITWLLICQPIFNESSKFFVSSLIRYWRYFVTAHLKKHLKKWLLHDIPNIWNNWLLALGQALLQWILEQLPGSMMLLFCALVSLALASVF